MNQKQIQKIVQHFASEVTKEIGEHLVEIIWYGSTARGEGSKDSDIDILLLTTEENHDLRKWAVNISSQISLKHDCLIAISVISTTRFRQMLKKGRLYAKNIEKQGIRIWRKAI